MKKIIFILFLLLSVSCFQMLEHSLDRMEKKLDKIEDECRVNCSEYKVSTIEWCECMDACLNKKDNMKIEIADCIPDSIKLKRTKSFKVEF